MNYRVIIHPEKVNGVPGSDMSERSGHYWRIIDEFENKVTWGLASTLHDAFAEAENALSYYIPPVASLTSYFK